MITNQTVSMVQSTVRAAGASSPGDKRRLLEAIHAELGIQLGSIDTIAKTDSVIPFREAAMRLAMKPRTLTAEITAGRIRAVRKMLTGKRPRAVGISASELEAYITRQQEVSA
jgi:hypothetical protein